MKSETIGKLAEALAKAQKEMENAKKDTENPFFKSRYADLAAIINEIKEPLANHGLSYVQYPEELNGAEYLTTLLMHVSGEWISGSMKLVMSKPDMQGKGSALTYARRYGLSCMVGISQEDDDGNAASAPAQVTYYNTKTGVPSPRVAAPKEALVQAKAMNASVKAAQTALNKQPSPAPSQDEPPEWAR